MRIAASTRLDMRTLELAHDVALIRLSWLDARKGLSVDGTPTSVL